MVACCEMPGEGKVWAPRAPPAEALPLAASSLVAAPYRTCLRKWAPLFCSPLASVLVPGRARRFATCRASSSPEAPSSASRAASLRDARRDPAAKMSHTRTVTRISVKNEDCCSIPGLLRVSETVFGTICLGLMLHYTKHSQVDLFAMPGHELYFILTAFGCLLCTFMLLVSSCWSFTSSSLLSRTSFEILFHLVACALYLAAGITLLTKTLDYDRRFRGEHYDARIAAAVFGIMNGALYLIGAVLSFRIFRQG